MADRNQSSPTAVAGDLRAFLLRLGERVRKIRNGRGMSRKALAKHSDVSERYLAQLESGTGNCSIVLLRRIAQLDFHGISGHPAAGQKALQSRDRRRMHDISPERTERRLPSQQ